MRPRQRLWTCDSSARTVADSTRQRRLSIEPLSSRLLLAIDSCPASIDAIVGHTLTVAEVAPPLRSEYAAGQAQTAQARTALEWNNELIPEAEAMGDSARTLMLPPRTTPPPRVTPPPPVPPPINPSPLPNPRDNYEITRIDVFSESLMRIVPSLTEGDVFQIEVSVRGPFDQRQVLIVTADLNFNGTIEANERFERRDIAGELDRYFFSGIRVLDDGRWPGNGTASDNLRIKVYLADVEATRQIPVLNANPHIVGLPSIGFAKDADGNDVVRVTVQVTDRGIHDVHTVWLEWPNGVRVGGSQFQPTHTCGGHPSKTFVVDRVINQTVRPLPLTIKVVDDDLGVATFAMESLDLALNNDDDNQNNTIDMNERGVQGEDEIRPFNMRPLIRAGTNANTGVYILNYQLSAIRVWDSPAKNHLIRPYGAFAGGPGNLPNVPTIQYTGQTDVFIEGVADGQTSLNLAWIRTEDLVGWFPNICDNKALVGGTALVSVWSIDVDVDSDNDNGFDLPEFDPWEDYLEASPYALGKLIEPNAARFVPVTLQLPKNLEFGGAFVGIALATEHHGRSSGTIRMWKRDRHDPQRVPGDRLGMLEVHSLHDLPYDNATGRVQLFMEATAVFPGHDVKIEMDAGKPDDRLIARVFGLAEDIDVEDEIKWMAVNPNSFYPTLNRSKAVRNAGVSEAVYEKASKETFAQKYLTEDEVRTLIGNHLDGVLDNFALPNAMNALFGPKPGWPPIVGLKAGIYWDHAASHSGDYVLAFAGTEDFQDWVTNVLNFVAPGEPQYWSAMILTEILKQVPAFNSLMLTGHSLGGGLASAAAVAINVPAQTYNASGFPVHTLYDPNHLERLIYGAGSLQRYHNSKTLIDNFVVYFTPTRRDTPDFLTWVQSTASLVRTPAGAIGLPHARGEFHKMEGLYDFTFPEELVIDGAEALLTGHSDFSDFVIQVVGWLTDNTTNAFKKMEESHRFPSIYYGLLHDRQGWNVYDGRIH